MTQDSYAPLIGFGTRVRKSPFFNSTRRWGCKAYTVYNRMYMPAYYENPVADYWRLVNDVTLWDVTAERQVEITGPDAARFTQMLTPRNLDKCAIGRLTSCLYSPRLKKNIGLAMVGAEHAEVGTKVPVQTPWHKAFATVVPTPFHEPKVAAQG